MTPLSGRLRAGEGRELLAALVTVFLVMVAHAQLETARDTLFLTNVPPSRLPWLYLAIAVLAVIGGPILGRPGSARGDRRTLIAMQLAAAAGTAAFLLPWDSRRTMFYALYIWGGMAAAVILTRFWLILGNRLSGAQAKRLFPLVAAGAVAGSLAGFAGGGLLAADLGARALLASSAASFLLSAVATLAWWWLPAPAAADGAAPPAAGDGDPRAERLRVAARHPYIRRLAGLLLLASVSVTLADYIFKNAVAAAVPGPRLGSFLAGAYFLFDLAALVLLLIAVPLAVRWLGAPLALAVRPLCLVVGGAALALGGGFAVALAVRGVDGSLRWSLHKTASELLYVPLAPRLRAAVKEISDLVGQRGGQALGSLVILGCLGLAADPTPWVGAAMVVGALAWIGLAHGLRAPYLRLFRETLDDAAGDPRLAFPDLDVGSLETLLAALNSPDEARVCAALDLLAATGRARVVPALILYHPSPAVVGRALELFAAARRADVVPFAPRLLGHVSAAVRAAAVRTLAAVAPDAEALRGAAAAECPIVAATATVALAARGAIDPAAAAATLDAAWAAVPPGADTDPRPHVARALRDAPLPAFAPRLAALAAEGPAATRREAVLALGALRDPAHLPLLVDLLAERPLREAVSRILPAYGEAGLAALAAALGDRRRPYALRVHLPRAVARFGHQHAADLLLARLRDEPGGMLRYRILRALNRLLNDAPGVRFDAAALDPVVDDHLAAAFPNLHWLTVLRADADEEAGRRTTGQRLLIDLIAQRQAFAVERLFRVLGLRVPEDDFAQLYDGVHDPDPEARAAARELLERVVPGRWRGAVLALVDDVADAERLASSAPHYRAEPIAYDALLRELAVHPSDAVASLAAYHAVELGLLARDGVRRAGETGVHWFDAVREEPPPLAAGGMP